LTQDLFADIHCCGLEPERWPATLRRISAELGGTSMFLTHEIVDLFGTSEPWVHEYDPAVYRSAAREMLSIDRNSAMRHLATAPLGLPYDHREFLGDSDGDPVARHFLGEADIAHATFCTVHRDAGSVSIVAFGRNARRADFDSREIAAIEAFSRHIGLAMRTHCALARERGRATAFSSVIDRLSEGVVLMDADLRVRHANRAAEAMFEMNDGVSFRKGRLQLRDSHAQRRLSIAARAICRGVPDCVESRILARRISAGAPYVLVAGRALTEPVSLFDHRGQLIVFLSDPELSTSLESANAMWNLFELSRAEARVASVALRGVSIHEIADTLCLSENTVKSHLKAIYGKLGVGRQAEFVRVATASIPALLD